MKGVVALGDLVMDLITPVRLPIMPGENQEITSFEPQPGGGCNFLIHAARLGVPVAAVGVVGADPFGDQLTAILAEEGVDTRPVFAAPGSVTATVLDLIDHEQKLHTFVGHAAKGDPMPVTPLAKSLIEAAGAVFLQGYTLLETQMHAPLPGLLQIARVAQIPVYYDVGPPTRYADPERLRMVLTHAYGVMTTEDEVPLAAQGLTSDEAYAYLFGLGVQLIVVKRGPHGCLLVTPDGREAVPAYPVEVADTVGAGDCFNAGFLYGRMHGWSLTDCARLANASGGACAMKVGAGRNVPTRAEVAELLERHGVGLSLPHP
jgi:sugar/nucleoside kinase (ribokinase family)